MGIFKRIYAEMKASDRNCTTCRFWSGTRKINTKKNTVKTKYSECAKCKLCQNGILCAFQMVCDKYEILPEMQRDVTINIRRGAKEIGGSAIEITASNGARIVFDIGMPLDAEVNSPDLLPKIAGLQKKTSNLLGVFISHAHMDHYGLGKWIDKKIPVYIGKDANNIIKAMNEYLTRAGITESFEFKNTIEIQDRVTVKVGPFSITPYLVDHAAYKSFAFLIDVDGKRIFYTGDFRTHGRCGAMTKRIIKQPPVNVDVMLMEGSSIERLNPDAHFETEIELEQKFKESFQSTKGLVLVQSSSQNIDRIVSIYKAAKATHRTLVMSSYTGYMLMVLENDKLPNFTWPNVKKFSMNPTKRHEISAEQIAENPGKYVYIVGSSNLDSIENAGLLNENASYIFSMWAGYRDTIAKSVIERMQSCNVPVSQIHTSGHADIPSLRQVVAAVAPKTLVPIHTFYPEKFDELFGEFTTVKLHSDNEDFTV